MESARVPQDATPLEPDLSPPLRELRESSVFQEARWGMALLGTDFTILRVNPALARLVGRSAREMESTPPDRFIHPEDLPPVAAYFAALRDGNPVAPFVLKRCALAGGGYTWTETSISPVRCASGRLAGYLAQLQDVDARVRAEETLLRERSLFLSGPVVIFRWRHAPGWPVEHVTPNVESEFGWPAEALLSGRIAYSELVHPGDIARVAEEVRAHLGAGRASFEQHYRIRNRDGRYRFVQDRTVVHRDAAGAVTALEGYLLDETRRIEAEAELRRTADDQRLLQRCSRNLLAAQGPPDMVEVVREALRERFGLEHAWIYVLDAEDPGLVRLLTGVGPMAERASRIAAELRISAIPLLREAHAGEIGVYCGDARTDPRVDPALVAALDCRSLLAVPLLGEGRQFGTLWTGTFGAEGTLDPDAAGLEFFHNLGGLLALAFDRYRSEEQRRRTEQRLRHAEKLEAVGRLAGGVAHNFNNALTVVLGHASLILADEALAAKHRAALEAILRAGQGSATTVRQLLQFARPEPLRATERVDPARVLREFERMVQPLLDESIQVELRLTEPLPSLELDGGALEMILMNLVLNARDAMRGAGILRIRAAAVEIGAEDLSVRGLRRAGHHLQLTVEDTGHGMDEATRARVFEPFFTTKGSQGTGLGLPAVYGAVVHAGGSVDVRSRPGHGSVFTILLPAAPPAAAAVAPAARTIRGGGRHVLVVEDESAVRLLLTRALHAAGFAVLTAESAEQALRKLEAETGPPALLLTDVVMPGASGVQLAERARRRWPGLPVLLTSGYAGDFERAIGSDGLAFLRKPFTREELLQAVAGVLEPESARGGR